MPPPVLELGQDEAGEGATSAFVEALRQWAAKKLQEGQGAQGKQGGGGRTGLLGAGRQKGQSRTGLQDAGQAASQPRTGLQDAEQGSQPRTGLQDAGQAGSQPRTGLQDAEQGSQPRTGLQDAEQGSQGNNDDTDQKPSACARCGAMVNHNDAVRGLHECDDLVESAPLSDSFVAQLTICLECDTVVECDKLCHCYQLGGQHGDPVGVVQVDSQGYSLGEQHGDQDGIQDGIQGDIQDGDQDGDQDGEQHGEQQEGESTAVEPPPNCARETVRDQESDSSSEMDCSSENVTPVGASGPSTTSDNQGRLRCRPIKELQMEGKIYRRIDAPPILSPQRVAHQTHSPPPLSPLNEPPTSGAPLRSSRQESEDDEEAAELLATPILQTNSPQTAAVHPHSTPLLDTEQLSLVPQSHVHRASAATAPRQPCLPCLMCPESEAVLMTSHDLDAHMFEAHGGTAGDVQCGACQVHFRDEDTLLAHARRCHDGLLFDVALLGASAAQGEAVCRLCWRQFADKAAVRTHQEAQHMGVVPLDRLEHLASMLLNLRLTHVSGQDPDGRAEDDAEVEIVGEVSSPHTYGGARRCDCANCLGVIRRRPTQQLINSRIETHTR
ncbi:uncharacterized protein LOC113217631 isoform X2 [Frankliniella occidentalis]|uniref:Uncharacterized protein LOC113217631 isoform X2 n=1 Tax=Frankliniella occidentalis TaxID=133901 RepID=A0A9C6WS03_FRAOC|nr:uncharacterized protein LOC113217631 isoform X2 [Frankliniella occidentalis]